MASLVAGGFLLLASLHAAYLVTQLCSVTTREPLISKFRVCLPPQVFNTAAKTGYPADRLRRRRTGRLGRSSPETAVLLLASGSLRPCSYLGRILAETVPVARR
jgi:hypothetical protein